MMAHVGGTTDRNSLSARQADGAAMLVEVDAAAVAKLLLVRFIAEGREVIRRLPVRKEVEQPQKLAVNAPRGRQARGQKRQRPIASIQLPVVADLVSGSLVKELVGPVPVAQPWPSTSRRVYSANSFVDPSLQNGRPLKAGRALACGGIALAATVRTRTPCRPMP